ncbi:MAG: hypothetical protein ACLQVX_24690 [Limisphaerales bacterium]
MSVVVSDTSPLHYLILCKAETILPRLFRQVVMPPTVSPRDAANQYAATRASVGVRLA